MTFSRSIIRRFDATLESLHLNIPSHGLDGYRRVRSQEANSRRQRPYASHGQWAGAPEAQAAIDGDGAVQAQQGVAAEFDPSNNGTRKLMTSR